VDAWSRRGFLRLASQLLGSAALGGLAAACASGQAPPATSQPVPTSPPTAPPPPANTPTPTIAPRLAFSIAYTSTGGFNVPLWLADAQHLFDDFNVTVALSLIQANAAVAALLAHTVDAILQSAAPVITADLNGNTDLVFVASTGNHPVFALYTEPAIAAGDDLRGKVVATDRPGAPNDYGARALLARLRLSYSDIQPLPVGGSGSTIAALLSGQAQAAVLTPPEAFRAEAAGFHQIANIFDGQYQGAGVVMQRSRLDERGPAGLAFLKGLRRGIQTYNDQPDRALEALATYGQEADPDVAQKTYAFYRTQAPFQVDLRPTLEGIQSMLDFLGDTLPAARSAAPSQFVDGRLLDQLAT
jgi:ABC-type nitrate/sulfonate/bicarbonate transport system substrate-binding protein